jgi:two-component sensor histidine kinase
MLDHPWSAVPRIRLVDDSEMAEILVSEIRHRIHNDLQWIACLATIQGRRTDDPGARAGFKAIARHVTALAPLYEIMLPSDSNREVDFGDYLYDLCSRIGDTGVLEESNVQLAVELTSVILPRDTAATLGIVVNELLTNAFKHAFPKGRHGQICVRLHADANGIILVLADDGCGLRCAAGQQGHGLWLVRELIRRIGGSIEHLNDSGTVWRIMISRIP